MFMSITKFKIQKPVQFQSLKMRWHHVLRDKNKNTEHPI